MPLEVQDLVFSLEIKSNTQAALKVKDLQDQELEVVFNCGRTSGTPGSVEDLTLDVLKVALREMLDQLP